MKAIENWGDVTIAVEDRVKELSTESVFRDVVEEMAKPQVEKRKTWVAACFTKWRELKGKLNSIKSTYTSYDVEGKGIGPEGYTQQQIQERKKLLKDIEALDAALTAAASGDYSKVEKLAN